MNTLSAIGLAIEGLQIAYAFYQKVQNANAEVKEQITTLTLLNMRITDWRVAFNESGALADLSQLEHDALLSCLSSIKDKKNFLLEKLNGFEERVRKAENGVEGVLDKALWAYNDQAEVKQQLDEFTKKVDFADKVIMARVANV